MQTLTKKTLKELLTSANHALSVEDFDDIEALDELAKKFTGVTNRERRLLNSPFELCGVKFYPLTVAKSLWFTEKVEDWAVEAAEQEAFLFWVLTLPNSDTVFEEYTSFKQAAKAAKKLARRLHCTAEELADVYGKCVGISATSDDSNTDSPADYGGTISALIKEYGGTPNLWLYETPVEVVASLFDQFEKRIAAEENATRTKSAKGGKAIAPKPTAQMAAQNKFNIKVQEIKEKWSATDGE